MLSKIDYKINSNLEQEKKLTEIYLGYEPTEVIFSKVEYMASCTEAIDFTLFDKTICGLLAVEETLSLEEIGRILGLNVIDIPEIKKYKDNAEYEILKDALQSLLDYEMIESEDIYFSQCRLTPLGREYYKRGKKFIIHENKSFNLYFDHTTQNNVKARENFEFCKGEIIGDFESEFNYQDENFLKTFAEYQIPEIFDPKKMNSFTNPMTMRIDNFKRIFYKAIFLDIITGELKSQIIDPKTFKVHEFFTKNLCANSNQNDLYSVINKYSLNKTVSNESKLVLNFIDWQDKIDQLFLKNKVDDIFPVTKKLIVESPFIELTMFFNHFDLITENSINEIWLFIKDLSSDFLDVLKGIIQSTPEKKFFLVAIDNEASSSFQKSTFANPEHYSNCYVLLQNEVKEFKAVFKSNENNWFVCKEDKFNLPIRVENNQLSVRKGFISKNIIDTDLEQRYLRNYRIQIAKEYLPFIHSKIEQYFKDLDLEKETRLSKISEIENKVDWFSSFDGINEIQSFLIPLMEKQNEAIEIIKKNRVADLNRYIGGLQLKIESLENPNDIIIESYRERILRKKDDCLIEEFPLFDALEMQLEKMKVDYELLKKRRSIIIDTNILVKDPNIMSVLGHNHTIVFSAKVIDELDKLKGRKETKASAKLAIRNIRRISKNRNVKFERSQVKNLPIDFEKSSPDNMILSVALRYKHKNPLLLTNDHGMSLKARVLEIPTKSDNELKEVFA